MENNDALPITFQMALAHNESSFSAFLKMGEDAQASIINQANNIKTLREMNIFVANIPKNVEKTDAL